MVKCRVWDGTIRNINVWDGIIRNINYIIKEAPATGECRLRGIDSGRSTGRGSAFSRNADSGTARKHLQHSPASGIPHTAVSPAPAATNRYAPSV